MTRIGGRMKLARGTVLDSRYKIVRQLGKGGQANVVCAMDERLGRLVALKILRHRSTAGEVTLKRFEREFLACQKLSHPNIVTMLDYGRLHDGTPFYAMQYLPFPSLAWLIKKEDRLDTEIVIDVLRQIADAFTHFHAAGVVHRDVKPSNIIITDENKVVLVDFGLVHDSCRTRLTGSDVVVGTPANMSPEQAGGGPIDHRCDIFQLGIVAYECLTGKNPFIGNTAIATMHRIFTGAYDRLAKVRPSYAQVWDDFLARCLAVEPDDRYQSGEEIKRALGTVSRRSKAFGVSGTGVEGEGNRSGPGRPVRFAPLLVLSVFVAVMLAVFTRDPGTAFNVTDIAVERPAGGLRVSWRSGKPYRGRLLVVTDRARKSLAEETASDRHIVEIRGLGENVACRVYIIFPDGTKSFPLKATTGEFRITIRRISSDASYYRLECSVDKASRKGEFIVRSVRHGVLTMCFTIDDERSFSLALPRRLAPFKDLRIKLFLRGGPACCHSLGKAIERLALVYGKELDALDTKRVTRGVNSEMMQSPVSTVEMLGSKHGMSEEEEKRMARTRRKLAGRLKNRIEEGGLLEKYEAAAGGASFVFDCRMISSACRIALMQSITPWLELSAFLSFHCIPYRGIEFPDLASFRLTYKPPDENFAGTRVVGRRPGDPLRLGPGLCTKYAALVASALPKSINRSVGVSGTDSVEEACFRIRASGLGQNALRLRLNEKVGLLVYDRLRYPYQSIVTIYQYLPADMLENGVNRLDLKFDGLFGRLGSLTDEIDIYEITLLLKKRKVTVQR